MIINGFELLKWVPIKDMVDHKVQASPTSWGLTECGYDIRIKQDIVIHSDEFVLASSMEEFDMPCNLMGQVMNKSTWARLGLDASATTNVEPGWKGFLTIELHNRSRKPVHIPAGAGIVQVLFHELKVLAAYRGKYQNQADRPVGAK